MATKKFTYLIGTKGARRAEKQLRGVDRATQAMVGSAARLAIGFISIAAAVKGLQFAFSAAKLSAQAENVERAFGNLAIQAGTTADIMIKKMREATAETISDFQLMQQFNTAAMLGLPLDQFDKMIEIARGAARAMGTSMQFMLQSIVTGIGRQSKLMLDNLGILISMETANKKYAEALGIQASKLTDVERKQAFANEAVRIGLENLKAAGGIVASNADVYEQAVAGLENVKIALGELISPIVVLLMNNFTNGYNVLLRMLGKDGESEIQKAANDVFELQTAIKNIQAGNIAWLNIVRELNIEMDLNATLADKSAILYDAEAAALTRLMDLRSAEKLATLTAWAGVLEETAEATKKITRNLEEAEAPFKRFDDTIRVLDTSQQLLIDNVEELTDGLIQATLYGQRFGDAIVSSLKAIAAELIKQAAVFLLMNLFTGGTASLTGARGFFNFAATGNFIPPAPSINSGGGNQGPAVINQNTFLIINDEQATELQSILNRAQFNA